MTLDEIKARCFVDDCWHWLGAVEHGYPTAKIDGKNTRLRTYLFGNAGKGKYVGTTCGNRDCLNPHHIRALNRVRLKPDAVAKAKMTQAARARAKKLDYEKAAEIRRLGAEGVTQKEIAEKMGISTAMANKVLLGRSWREASPWAI